MDTLNGGPVISFEEAGRKYLHWQFWNLFLMFFCNYKRCLKAENLFCYHLLQFISFVPITAVVIYWHGDLHSSFTIEKTKVASLFAKCCLIWLFLFTYKWRTFFIKRLILKKLQIYARCELPYNLTSV